MWLGCVACIALLLGCGRGPDGVRASPSLYCEGTEPWPAATKLCRIQADCSKDQQCLLSIPSPAPMCGACEDPRVECRSDADCSNGICEPGGEMPAGACRCTGAAGTHCEPRCTETSCGEGRACGDDGRCKYVIPPTPPPPPPTCWQGGQCAKNQDCVRDQGCVMRRCRRDADCDCGTCVTGTCQPRPGVCVTPAPYVPPPP